MQKLISIVIPMLNESGNVDRLYAALLEVMQNLSYDFEIILVDDGSRDATWYKIQQLSEHDARVRGIQLTRNFGTQSATSAGYEMARGDAVITLDADLQHPPSLIPEMIAAWEQGFLIVCPRRMVWNESILKRITSRLHYSFLERFSGLHIPRNVNDFRLIDRAVVDLLNAMSEQPRFLRGMLAWLGFQTVFIKYESPHRVAGVTGYTWKKLLTLAIDGVVGFTKLPLVIPAYIGFAVFGGSVVGGSLAVFWKKSHLLQPIFLLAITGIQFLVLWVVGEYIARLNEQLRGRPLWVVQSRVGKL